MRSLLLVLIMASIIQASVANPIEVNPVITVAHVNPGDRNVGIQLILQNTQAESLNNVKVYLFLANPFSASSSPNNKLGELEYPGYLIGTGGSGEEYTQYFDLAPNMSHKTNFKIDVDTNAEYGTYELPYTIYYTKGEYNGKIKLSITGNTLIEIKNVSVAPAGVVEPGTVFKIAVHFENVGDNSIKWLKLSLSPIDKGLVPLLSSESIFTNLSSGSKSESEFQFSLERDAGAKNYPIDLLLNYMDEKGQEHNETKLVGIVAAGRASLDIAKKTTEPVRINENEPFILTLKIENTGTGDARGVSTYLESPLEGDTQSFLGEIKKDDYSNAIFTVDPAKSGKKISNLTITYEDDFGKHEIKKEVILIVNPVQSQNTIPTVVGVGIAASALFFWKRRKP
jgi:hypothetical protein